jgi:hypothetical protein
LFYGVIKYSKEQSILKNTNKNGKVKVKNKLKILFFMHAPNKSKILNIVFLPIFILKNQLINAAIVLFSSNPNNQIISTGAIFIAFTIYSLIFCPYRILFRVFYHISDLLLIGQLVFLFLVISTEYGATYSLNILNIEPSIYKYAWILLIFDFMQMINYGVLSFVILY